MSIKSWLEKVEDRHIRGMSLDDARNTVVDLVAEVRRRGQMLAAKDRILMSRTEAWKAFRMGIIAGGAYIPEGNTVDAQHFWQRMRSRFNEWFISYEDQGGSVRDKKRRMAAGEVPTPKAFNPPRVDE